MTALLTLCHEVLHDIFTEVDPHDLAALSQTCSALHSYIKANQLLHRDVYVRHYDDPRVGSKETDLDWVIELQDAVRLTKLLETDDIGVKEENVEFVCAKAVRLIEQAPSDTSLSHNIDLLTDLLAYHEENSQAFVLSSNLFMNARRKGEEKPVEVSRLIAHVHCLVGTCQDDFAPSMRHSGIKAHSVARSKVYDLRMYTDQTKWGPFLPDGSMRVDWEKVEAIMIDIAYNLQLLWDRTEAEVPRVWENPFEGVTAGSYVPKLGLGPINPCPLDPSALLVLQPDPPLEALDPYGITGTWRRVVCFLDYNDFYQFNFATHLPLPALRPPINIQEAVRLIVMKVQVMSIEEPGPDDGNDLPIVKFKGTSKSLHQHWDPNANSQLRGSVRLTKEGQVRWTTLSIVNGEARWRSEGIQIGGVRSARGVAGTWFEKDYDRHGPAGPTAMWKITDQLSEEYEIHELPDVFQ